MRPPQKIRLPHMMELLHTKRLPHKIRLCHLKLILPHMMELDKKMRLPHRIRLARMRQSQKIRLVRMRQSQKIRLARMRQSQKIRLPHMMELPCTKEAASQNETISSNDRMRQLLPASSCVQQLRMNRQVLASDQCLLIESLGWRGTRI